jgi:hypothetical protein
MKTSHLVFVVAVMWTSGFLLGAAWQVSVCENAVRIERPAFERPSVERQSD